MKENFANKVILLWFIAYSSFAHIAYAGETWVLVGRDYRKELVNAPKNSVAEINGIGGFGFMVELQSIVKNENLIFYYEKPVLLNKSGNVMPGERENRKSYLRIVNCETQMFKNKEFGEWVKPVPGRYEVYKFLCSNYLKERHPKSGKGIEA